MSGASVELKGPMLKGVLAPVFGKPRPLPGLGESQSYWILTTNLLHPPSHPPSPPPNPASYFYTEAGDEQGQRSWASCSQYPSEVWVVLRESVFSMRVVSPETLDQQVALVPTLAFHLPVQSSSWLSRARLDSSTSCESLEGRNY